MIALLASGAIRTEPLTTDLYRLANVAAAFDALARREAIRPIITMQLPRPRPAHPRSLPCPSCDTLTSCRYGAGRGGPS